MKREARDATEGRQLLVWLLGQWVASMHNLHKLHNATDGYAYSQVLDIK
jgi:hypothetical protein